MDNNGIDLEWDSSGGARNWRTIVADLAWLALVAAGVVLFGGFVSVVGPLLAFACDTCEGGLRDPRYVDALLVTARFLVPATVLGTVAGMFLPRGGTRVGAMGAGLLVLLLGVILLLGRFPA